jgi:flagellar hook-basal body complex protein FliE
VSLNPIASNLVNLLNTAPVTSASPLASVTNQEGESFSDIFTAAMNNVAVTDDQDKASTLELLTGTTDDLTGLMADVQKAEIALNLSLQLRNKMLDAYQEIMNMQV